MIIGVTGTNGSGKGALVDYLVSKRFTHYSVRDEITAELKRRGLPIDRPHMGLVGNELREKYGAGYFVDLFLGRSKEKGIQTVAIESIRSIGEAHFLKEKGGVLIAVDAERPLRYRRVVGRGSGTDKVDFSTWVAQEEHEWHSTNAGGMNIPAVIALADYGVKNNGSLKELYMQIDQFLLQIKKSLCQ